MNNNNLTSTASTTTSAAIPISRGVEYRCGDWYVLVCLLRLDDMYCDEQPWCLFIYLFIYLFMMFLPLEILIYCLTYFNCWFLFYHFVSFGEILPSQRNEDDDQRWRSDPLSSMRIPNIVQDTDETMYVCRYGERKNICWNGDSLAHCYRLFVFFPLSLSYFLPSPYSFLSTLSSCSKIIAYKCCCSVFHVLVIQFEAR